jgi:pilus assembly protein CpaB
MRLRGILLIGVSLLFSVLAFALIRSHQNSGAGQTIKLVVARSVVNFGERVTPANLELVDYPTKLAPAGAFDTIDSVASQGEDRLALRTIAAGEVILPSNVSAKGARNVLSTVIGEGMRAITVPVNDVKGVAGFIRVSDRVDVLLTRNDHSQSDILLQNIRVLAVDQQANEDGKDKASVAKAVTLEVLPQDAQKLALGGSVGTLSLALRGSASGDAYTQHPILVSDLGGGEKPAAKPARAPRAAASIEILRGTDATTYTIGRDGLIDTNSGTGASASPGLPPALGRRISQTQ